MLLLDRLFLGVVWLAQSDGYLAQFTNLRVERERKGEAKRMQRVRTIPEANAFAVLLGKLCSRDGSYATSIPGFYITRSSTIDLPRTSLTQAVMCVVAQGSKSVLMNGKRCVYDSSRYLLVSLDLPLVGQIEEATRAKPYLGCSLVLDFEEIASLLVEAKIPRRPTEPVRPGLMVGTLDEELLDAVTRLARLTQHPEQTKVIAPLIRREIYYRLLLSEHSGLLQQMAAENGKTRRIATGLGWLRENASRPIRMAELARELHMSSSTMHAWFRSVTSMSPLQFQKQLRLHEARRIMLSEAIDANAAGRRVGYESPSQFSREYCRFFGAPPARDIEKLRLSGNLIGNEATKAPLKRVNPAMQGT